MRPARRVLLWGMAFAAGTVAAQAQSVISARSGLIHYVEGQVYLGDEQVDSKFGNFPEVKENAQLRTAEGRAEVLLTPGVFLRLGENSSFRMVTNRLIDTRLELLSGTAIVEAEDIPKDNSVTVVYKDASAHVLKKGLYRFDATAGELRVYDGAAQVSAGEKTVQVNEGHQIALDTLVATKFDKNLTDALDRWSARRAEYLSMANVSAANTLRGSMYYGGMFNSGWFWNPYFGMFTFVPGLDGMWYSPYGYRFWSPFDVYMAYMPGYYYYPSGYSSGSGYRRTYAGTGYTATTARPTPARGSGAITSAGARSGASSGFSSHGSSGISSVSSSAPISRGGGSSGMSGGGGPHH